MQNYWIPFAKCAIDSLLKWGYVVFVYEPDDQDDQFVPPRNEQKRKKKKKQAVENLVPLVPPSDTYDVAYVATGRAGYGRRYLVYSTAPNNATKIDFEARIFVRDPPDASGNVNSPMATIFDLGSFTSALTELALNAEVTNTRSRVWTQQQKEATNRGALDPQALFFDSESRDVAAKEASGDNAGQANALALQQQLCAVINKLQTRHEDGVYNTRSFSGGGMPEKSHVPPEIAPSLFCLPKVRSNSLTLSPGTFHIKHCPSCLFTGPRVRFRCRATSTRSRRF